MVLSNRILVLYNDVTEKASKDEIDVLYQVDAVSAALEQLGFSVSRQPLAVSREGMLDAVKTVKPLCVFNLVEEVSGSGRLCYLAPSILEALNVKYTGCSAEAIFLTTNKVTSKKLLKACSISTPRWVTLCDESDFIPGAKYIIKAVYEDGSVELHQDSVITAESPGRIREILESKKEQKGKEFFAEEYIDGREINVSLLGRAGGLEVLPPTEIRFIGYKDRNIAEIFDYRAKWEEDSFEYQNAVYTTCFDSSDNELLRQLEQISEVCWREFGLKGYARVDFRIDKEGIPWVLEINANPCITPGGSSFMKSAEQAGIGFKDVVERIITEV